MDVCGLCLLWDRPLKSISLSSCFFFTKDKRRRKRYERNLQHYKDSQVAVQQRASLSSYSRQHLQKQRRSFRRPRTITTVDEHGEDEYGEPLGIRPNTPRRSDSTSQNSSLWETASSSWGGADTSSIVSEDWSDASDMFFHVPSYTTTTTQSHAPKSRSFPYRIPRNEEHRRARSKRRLARRIAQEEQQQKLVYKY